MKKNKLFLWARCWIEPNTGAKRLDLKESSFMPDYHASGHGFQDCGQSVLYECFISTFGAFHKGQVKRFEIPVRHGAGKWKHASPKGFRANFF